MIQARGRSEEAEREVRALLALMCEHKATMQDNLPSVKQLLSRASCQLKILDRETGNQELIESMMAEVANLREMAGKVEGFVGY